MFTVLYFFASKYISVSSTCPNVEILILSNKKEMLTFRLSNAFESIKCIQRCTCRLSDCGYIEANIHVNHTVFIQLESESFLLFSLETVIKSVFIEFKNRAM